VADRTAKVEVQNKVLNSARNALNALPVGWSASSLRGQRCVVVCCSTMANRQVVREEPAGSGGFGQAQLSVDMGAAIEPLAAAESFCVHFQLWGNRVGIKGSILRVPGQEGLILVFDPDGED